MSLFDKLPQGSAPRFDSRHPKLGEGEYVVTWRDVRVFESQHPKTKGDICVVFEAEIEVSTNPDHPAGQVIGEGLTVPLAGNAEDKRELTLGNIYQIVGHAQGEDPGTLGPDALAQLEKDPSIIRGERGIITKEGPNQYNWSKPHYYPATPGEVARVQKLAERAGTLAAKADSQTPDDDDVDLP